MSIVLTARLSVPARGAAEAGVRQTAHLDRSCPSGNCERALTDDRAARGLNLIRSWPGFSLCCGQLHALHGVNRQRGVLPIQFETEFAQHREDGREVVKFGTFGNSAERGGNRIGLQPSLSSAKRPLSAVRFTTGMSAQFPI